MYLSPSVAGYIEALIGTTEADAVNRIRAAGLIDRVTMRDGDYYIITRDLRADRVNLHIEAGTVTKAEIG
jgi:hypothetical protein